MALETRGTALQELAAGAPREGQRRVPDFFIVGHPRCGTTALYEMLRAHPEIFMPDMKEPQFFATDLPKRRPGLPRTLEAYLALFGDAAANQRVGEASPSYLRSGSAARSIAALQPQARIIAILREPASFLRALHLNSVRHGDEPETNFERAIATQPRYVDRVRFVEELRRYHAVFPREQIMVVIYDDLQRDNPGTVRAMLRFLGVDDAFAVEPVRLNVSIGARSSHLHWLSRALIRERSPLARVAKRAIKATTTVGLRRQFRQRVLFGPPSSPDQRFVNELRRRFKQEVVALSEYLGRDLVTLWGYDDT